MVTVYAQRHDSFVNKPTPGGTIAPITVYPLRHDSVRLGRSNSAQFIQNVPGALPATVVGGVASYLLPPTAAAVPNYFVQVVDIYGVLQGTLVSGSGLGVDNFTIGPCTWELNGSGSASCVGPVTDNSLPTLIDFNGNVKDGMELRFMRELDPFYWMVPLTPTADDQRITISGPGFPYALSRRFVGRDGAPPNLVTNGSFQTNVVGWTTAGATIDWSASPSYQKGGSATLTAPTPGNNFVFQNILLPSQPFDTFLWVTAWMYLDTAPAQNALPTSGRSVWAVFTVNGVVVYQQGYVPNWRMVGRWQPIKTQIYLPANQTATMQLRLYSPKGQIRYDEVNVRREERLFASGSAEAIIQALVAHGQQVSIGKEPANILFDGSLSGGNGQFGRGYKYAERANIMSAMNEFPGLSAGVNWTGEIQSGTGRFIVTLPRYGATPANKVTLEWGRNISRYQWRWDGSRRADKVIVGSRGSGFDFVEGFYDDPTTHLGWEAYRPARVETLTPQEEADGLGQAYTRPISLDITAHRTATQDLFDAWKSGDFRVGRLCTVKINYGFIRVNEDMIIQRLTFNPGPETWQASVIRAANLV